MELIEWHRDHAASGWRSRAWLDPQWELLVYDDGEWEVRGPPLGETLASGKARSIPEGKIMAQITGNAYLREMVRQSWQ